MRTSIKTLISILLLAVSSFAQRGTFIAQNVTAGPATPAILQFGTCDTAVATCTLTFGSPVGAGHYLVCYAVGTGNSTGVSCTMSGETLTRRTGAGGCSNNTSLEADCYTSNSTVGGQTAITCTMSTGSGGRCEFAEVSSPSAGNAIDTGGNGRVTTTAFSVATNAATTNAGDICIAMGFNAFASSPGYTAQSWTSVINSFNSNGTLLMMSTLPGSTGTQTATATAQSGVSNQPEGVLCLKP
jgi:hypothetical protein